ncbi:initiator tRNA phosphoribosyl transferase [Poronia punctata]|nr:initiator tRNA phosphoribosyl transferase [Poronia punctata]
MPTESDLIFSPQANHNFSRILTDLKRSNLSISNRLRSILIDADFINQISTTIFPTRPLIANERCGSWYIDPEVKSGSAYFKSTDGHAGQWNFSCRRLNLHLLPIIGKNDGCVIVDSTRRGKSMPDALSKTVPIWCCVLNRVLFGDRDGDELDLYTPPQVVSRSEHAQAEKRIPEHVDALKALGILDIPALRRQISKPLRPFWVTPESAAQQLGFMDTDVVFEDFHPVICCTSSRRVVGGEMSEGGYIQGAGDDTENWAMGLTASVFWRNKDVLISAAEADLPELVKKILVAGEKEEQDDDDDDVGVVGKNRNTPVQVLPGIFVGKVPEGKDRTPTIAFVPGTTAHDTWEKSPVYMEVGIGKQAKIASRNLRAALPTICSFAARHIATDQVKRVLIVCESGKDLSVGVALALACQFFDADGNYVSSETGAGVDVNKSVIKTKLGRIMMAFPEANPSRTTLQSVNSYLMG